MDYIKIKWQQSRKSYFILAVVLIVNSVILAVYTIIHPRIYFVGMLLVLLLFSVRVWKQMKEAAPDVYRAFPESLLKGASNVKWIVCPGFYKGLPLRFWHFGLTENIWNR